VLRVLTCGFLLTAASSAPLFAQTETWRVLALRVSFPPETPDDETTSGTGTFDLRSTAEALPEYALPFDTPPHDRSYFENHLQALANYFGAVSDGRLRIEYDVFPPDPNGSYLLETELKDYGNGRTSREIGERIVRLFHDSVTKADQDEGASLDFSQYRSVIVFHAGLGGEAGNALNDVASAFVSARDLLEHFEGPIPVDTGSHFVSDGLLLPEAISSDGTGGLNGTLARFFGSQLGLPGLSNFEEDLPAVGDWSLMDTGGAGNLASVTRLGLSHLSATPSDTLLVGYLPSRPLAWSRMRLGWLEPLTVTHDDTISIAAPHLTTAFPEAIKVPLSADEYFLIENRMSRLAVEGRMPEIVFSNGDAGGVWLQTDDYDAFIPGSGIMVWHVDDAVVRSTGEGEFLNSNQKYRIAFGEYRKAISLKEADGFQDIGNISSNRVVQGGIISFANIEGGAEDPFFVGNRTVMGPDTTPSTNSNLRYRTGITIEVLSPPGEVMQVAVRFGREGNWPVTGLGRNGNQAPRAFDSEQDGAKEILRSMNSVDLYDLSGTLEGNLGNRASADKTPATGLIDISAFGGLVPMVVGYTGSRPWLRAGLDDGAEIFDTGAWAGTPSILAFPSETTSAVLANTDGGVRWGLFGGISGYVDVSTVLVLEIVAGDLDLDGGNELIAIDAADGVYVIEETNDSRVLVVMPAPIVGAPAVADLDRDGDDEVVIVTNDGVVTVLDDVGIVVQSQPVDGGASSGPVLGDLDGDGFVEVLFGGNGTLWAMRFNGVLQTGAPVGLPLKDEAGPIEGPPVLADLDNDGGADILVGTRGGLVYGMRSDGEPLPGFPVATVGPIRASLLVEDLDADGTLEIVAFTDDGAIDLWHAEQIDASLTGSRVIWGQLGGSGANTGHLQEAPTATPTAVSEALLPKAKAYVYPNPVRDGRAFLRYYLGANADVTAMVINAVGEIVERLDVGMPTALTDNEIVWDTREYASGLYICRIEAVSGSRKEVRLIKAAVIR